MENKIEKKKITIEEVITAFKEIYLLADEGVVPMMLATVIANRLFLDDHPVWLLFLAGSSSGKTALMQTLDKIGPWIIPIDTLTTNTFASGLTRTEETSLLHKANRGILVFKDFTTLTSMNEEGLRELMGQLRAIYDGSFNKKTGNAQDIDWHGKVGVIAGGTIAVQRKMREYSAQGERFLNYCIAQPNAIEMTTRAVRNQRNLKEKEEKLQLFVKDFIDQIMSGGTTKEFRVPEAIETEMIRVADFSTLARSPVMLDKKTGHVSWVPEREMPSRMAIQLFNLAKALMIMSDEKVLSERNAKILYQCAMDSIPTERRLAMKVLTEYMSASTKNMAIHLNYPTDAVLSWLMQLNARKLIDRVARGDGSADTWVLKPEYKIVMAKYERIRERSEHLTPTEEEIKKFETAQAEVISATDDSLLNQIYSAKREDESDITVFDNPTVPPPAESKPIEIPLDW